MDVTTEEGGGVIVWAGIIGIILVVLLIVPDEIKITAKACIAFLNKYLGFFGS